MCHRLNYKPFAFFHELFHFPTFVTLAERFCIAFFYWRALC